MTDVVLVHMRAETALGNLEETWTRILRGESGLRSLNFGGAAPVPAGIISTLGDDFGSAARLDRLIERLLDGFCLPMAPTTPLFVATTKAAADELFSGPPGPWPGQPWELAGNVATRLGFTGEAVTVSAACASGAMALMSAAHRICDGAAAALVVGVEVLCRFVLAGFAVLQGLTPDHCRPFDRHRNGLAIGEGAGLILLASRDEAERRGWPVLAVLSGWGAACDATHITAPCRDGAGLSACIRQALGHAPQSVGGIIAHGTGTPYNDAMELTAFAGLWPEKPPPISSVKGAIGHCLGAAGVIETAIAVKSLEAGCIPPTVGLVERERVGLPLAGDAALPLAAGSVLKCNSGFGGINAALLLEKAGPKFSKSSELLTSTDCV